MKSFSRLLVILALPSSLTMGRDRQGASRDWSFAYNHSQILSSQRTRMPVLVLPLWSMSTKAHRRQDQVATHAGFGTW